MKRILTLILIATLILTAALFSPCCAQGETNESETNHTSDALFANKLTWHGDIDGARGAVVEGTIAYIASRASAETIRGHLFPIAQIQVTSSYDHIRHRQPI